jgi:HlyD family secretion protein
LLSAQVQLRENTIVAPFAGTITQRYASEGAFVTPTTTASTSASATSSSIVAIAREIEVRAKVPEVDIGKIQIGQPLEIAADAFPEGQFTGKVRLIAPEAVVEQNVTSFEVRAAIENGRNELKSGMNVNITFLGERQANALMVPTVAIATRRGQTGVFVPDNNSEPRFQVVKIGSTFRDKTQVLEGLKPGDMVFTDVPRGFKEKMSQ